MGQISGTELNNENASLKAELHGLGRRVIRARRRLKFMEKLILPLRLATMLIVILLGLSYAIRLKGG